MCVFVRMGHCSSCGCSRMGANLVCLCAFGGIRPQREQIVHEQSLDFLCHSPSHSIPCHAVHGARCSADTQAYRLNYLPGDAHPQTERAHTHTLALTRQICLAEQIMTDEISSSRCMSNKTNARNNRVSSFFIPNVCKTSVFDGADIRCACFCWFGIFQRRAETWSRQWSDIMWPSCSLCDVVVDVCSAC